MVARNSNERENGKVGESKNDEGELYIREKISGRPGFWSVFGFFTTGHDSPFLRGFYFTNPYRIQLVLYETVSLWDGSI